jgi:hypothetical protein
MTAIADTRFLRYSAKDRIKAAQEEQAKVAQAKAVAEGANTEEIAIDDEDE